jgi:exopolysaccharide production protein ExoQ
MPELIASAEMRKARAVPVAEGSPLSGVFGAFEAGVCIVGIMMLLEVVRFFVTGNSAAYDPLDPAAGNPMARAAWYPFYLALLAVAALRWREMLASLRPAALIYVLLAFSALSTLWSIAPELTSRRMIAMVFTVLFGVYLAMRGPWLSSLRLIGAAAFLVAVLHLIVVLVMPGLAIDHAVHIGAWKGMASEKNALGGDMARAGVVLLALAHLDRARRWTWTAGFVLSAIVVIGSTSTTAALALALVLVSFGLYLIARRSVAVALGMLYVGVVCFGGLIVAITLFPAQITALLGKDITLTGRTDIWLACWDAIVKRPWTGYGVGAFWLDIRGPSYYVREVLEWEVPSAHNNWLEIGLGLGVPGILLLAVIMVSGMVGGAVRMVSLRDPWILIALTQLLLFSFSESVILWFQNTFACVMFVFCITVVLQPMAQRRG